MKEDGIFEQYDFYRESSIQLLDSIASEKQADVIPNGYSNSLRWNLGHILVAQEGVMYYFGMNQPGDISTKIQESFKPGTSPKDWFASPLTLNEIQELLIEQKERIRDTFSGRLGEPAANAFEFRDKKLKMVGDLFIFTLWHEGLHQGVINGMKRALK
ncbi:DinB family protein [Alkalihalobacillus sp. TS-13]|uniref:DinB family protein n=1 Tax=Alkalihalobacillus sp. TS-13 TaxID=2842455 RepID=UPI001C87BA0B|nr:DinB family protein [Alkalihalobacillus sp. TS-13]